MKFIVDKLPKSPKECPFATNSTGKYRCRNTALLCPISRGEKCPYITTRSSKEAKETGDKE